ncbi:MAG: restriction endonuclease subunit S [Thermomicrobia bacterium]|nr:restriction endonuclease subunit S [Thermomicrobia bacterium]
MVIDNPNERRGKRGTTSLPTGWRWARLGDVATYHNGRAFKPDEWGSSGRPIIRIQNLSASGAVFNYYDGEVDKRHEVEDGDLLISWSASLDAYLWDSGPAVLNQHIFKVVEDPAVVQRAFLFFAVREAMSNIREQVHGATMQHITKPEFEAILIPLPPLDEQRRLVAMITGQMEAVERARSAAEAQRDAARRLPSVYLRSVFGTIPRGDHKAKLGDVLRLRKEIVHPRNNPIGLATFVGLEHIQSGTGRRTGAVDLEMSELTGRKPKFYRGDIVYGYLRPYLNKVWLAEFDGLCSVDQYVFTVVPERAEAAYIAWFMRSPAYLERAPIDTTPGQLPRIRTGEVASVELDLPTLSDQRRIVAAIHDRTRNIDCVYGGIAKQMETINVLPSALLRKVFNGGMMNESRPIVPMQGAALKDEESPAGVADAN